MSSKKVIIGLLYILKIKIPICENDFLQRGDAVLRGHHRRGLRHPPGHRLLHRQLAGHQSGQGRYAGTDRRSFAISNALGFPTQLFLRWLNI